MAAGAAFFLLICACAPPQPNKLANLASPAPSPSPTPTAPVSGSAEPFHTGEVGLNYSPVAIAPSGGVAPYTWSISEGALPGGLTLGSDGKVTGTPNAAGTFTFTIKLADSGDGFASIPGSITIASALSASLIPSCSSYCNVELGCVNVCGNFGSLGGGVGPYGYTLTQGPLPAGTALNGLSLTGTFKGLSGWLQFTVQVSDALGATATIAPKFWMYDHISLNGNTCTGRGSCQVTLTYDGGTPGPSPTIAVVGWAGDLKCGVVAAIKCPQPSFSATVLQGQVKVTIVYQPNYPATFGTFTVRLTDNSLCGSGTYCSSDATVTVVG